MSFRNLDMNSLPEEANVGRRTEHYDYVGQLCKEHLLVSPIAVRHLPISLPPTLRFSTHNVHPANYCPLNSLPSFEFIPYHLPSPAPDQRAEWKKFLTYLFERGKVVLIPVDGWELITKPPDVPPNEKTHLRVCYRKLGGSEAQRLSPISRTRPRGEVLDPPGQGHGSGYWYGMTHNAATGFVPVTPTSVVQPNQPRVAQMHPTYLRTLKQTHTSWIFGGLAELVDNARDAGAERLNISISKGKRKITGEVIPVLRVEDDGKGMTHADFVRMLSFGHSTPTNENMDQIGHFGVGFKTGAMRVGEDVLVLTQNESSRSIGLLSTAYNKDKEVLEIPIVTYKNPHGIMEMDLSVQTEAEGRACTEAVERYSPYDQIQIGDFFGQIKKTASKNGTMIFVYNLEKWGKEGDYTLQWDAGDSRDIIIRSKRPRSRVGQIGREVPLDYSLRSYLEVLFLDPRMIIRIQGSKVHTRRLKDSLNTTRRVQGKVLGKELELTLGRSAEEARLGNCGIFLYWHGRLIEAYRRVGGMVHSADVGRGVIGVIDVTSLMANNEGRVGVLNTKQGFEDSEEYVKLEAWLGDEFNKYWYKWFDRVDVAVVSTGQEFEPDREWVQCDKCQKWRKLPRGVHSNDLPEDWFCFMEPFCKTCNEPEEKADDDIVTVGTKLSSTAGAFTTPTGPKPRMVIPKEERCLLNLENNDAEIQSPVVPVRRQSTRKVSFKDPTRKTLDSADETYPIQGSRSRQDSESPPRRRLRRRG